MYVEFKREQMKMIELQLAAACGINEANSKIVMSLLDEYRGMILPETKAAKKSESFEDSARKQLAQEVKKAFIIRQTDGIDSAKLKKNPNAASLGAQYILEKNKNVVNRSSKSRKVVGVEEKR